MDEKQKLRAKKLRGDDRPLLLIEHLKRTTGQAPKLHFSHDLVSARIILATLLPDEERLAFAQKGIILDGPNEAEFFTTIQRLSSGDICGFLLTNSSDAVTKRTEAGMKWWVLRGEKLWFQTTLDDDCHINVHLADNRVLGPWGAEFELQTTLSVYRLIAANPKDARAWVDCLQIRIALATENELIMCADVLASDEANANWKRVDSILADLENLEGWCYSHATISQLCRVARIDGTEYLLLFYLDARSAIKSGNISVNTISRRFLSLASLPDSLQPLRQELTDATNENLLTLAMVKRLIDAIKDELEQGLLARFRAKDDLYTRLVAELPLLIEQEKNLSSG